MQIIAARVKRAFLIGDVLNDETVLSELLTSVIAGAGFGLLFATPDRRVLYANDTAKALIRSRSGLSFEHDHISVADFKTSRKLQALITSASRLTDDSLLGGSVIVRDEDGMASLVVHVVPLSRGAGVHLPDKEHFVAGLVIVDCTRATTDRINVFADLFTLTSAEARVVAELISGGGLAKAATRLNIARSTARAHLTHILEKTGTHRQAELVRVFYEVTIPWGRRSPNQDNSTVPLRSRLLVGPNARHPAEQSQSFR
ncbi:MAG TPA: LuxR C-terminal-related transcriptional regulator [Methylocella sp.]|nr:LuxR C-terminal-related transcriptional regulator [Methylocella sp.]